MFCLIARLTFSIFVVENRFQLFASRPFFFPVRFGIAKVETFLLFANFIFKFLKFLFPNPDPYFSPSIAGCKGINLFVFRSIYFNFFFTC